MDNIIDIKDLFAQQLESNEGEQSHEKFLVTEGLELLASYRAIKDPVMRASVRALLDALAKSAEKAKT